MAITQLGNDLKFIRELFLRSSGRSDLVDPSTLANLGADIYINAGQKYLDRRVDMPKTLGRRPFTAQPGQTFISCPDIRSIQGVTVVGSGSRDRLDKLDYSEWASKYPKLLSNTIPSDLMPPIYNSEPTGTGAPKHYTVAPTAISPDFARPVEHGSGEISNSSADTAGIMIAGHEWSGILVGPAPSTAMSITIWGKFFSPKLQSDGDQSYWSVVEPQLLLWASLYILEVSYRNREGQADWLGPINDRLKQIDHDSADEEWSEVNQMEG